MSKYTLLIHFSACLLPATTLRSNYFQQIQEQIFRQLIETLYGSNLTYVVPILYQCILLLSMHLF